MYRGEFLELQEFFPDVNIRKIAEIEAFHEKLIVIPKQQMEDEILRSAYVGCSSNGRDTSS